MLFIIYDRKNKLQFVDLLAMARSYTSKKFITLFPGVIVVNLGQSNDKGSIAFGGGQCKKLYLRLEKLARDKRSSLCCLTISDGEKKFYSIDIENFLNEQQIEKKSFGRKNETSCDCGS
jgi:hypothetical protein